MKVFITCHNKAYLFAPKEPQHILQYFAFNLISGVSAKFYDYTIFSQENIGYEGSSLYQEQFGMAKKRPIALRRSQGLFFETGTNTIHIPHQGKNENLLKLPDLPQLKLAIGLKIGGNGIVRQSRKTDNQG